MENRNLRLPGGRGRRPLADLTVQSNNRQNSHQDHAALPNKQSFTIFRDNQSNDENAPPPNHGFGKSKFPPPPPIPVAHSSPSAAAVPPAVASTSKSDQVLASSSPVIDAFSLISKSSASEFRRSANDSISSTTTNEEEFEDHCDVDQDDCDDQEEALEVVQEHHGEYALDILKKLQEREVNYLPKWNYMTKQPDITFTMRSILVDWLVEVCEEYKLNTETLFLAVNYIDRFLSLMSVQRAKLQLVGTACMFIASKYEEIYPPDVSEFCYITDDTYTKRQVLRMEQLVLGVLNFECAPPTAHFFVNHLAQLAGCGPRATALAQYLTELTLIDGEAFMPFSPSLIAAASVALSRHTLGLAAWDESMVAKTGYTVDHFKECLIRLHESFERAPEMAQQAVREKYKNASYHSVSEVTPTPIF